METLWHLESTWKERSGHLWGSSYVRCLLNDRVCGTDTWASVPPGFLCCVAHLEKGWCSLPPVERPCGNVMVNGCEWHDVSTAPAQLLSWVWLCAPHGLQPASLLCPWDSPGKNPGVGCHALLQGTFPTQGSNPGFLHCKQILYHWATRKAQMWARLVWIKRFQGILTETEPVKTDFSFGEPNDAKFWVLQEL